MLSPVKTAVGHCKDFQASCNQVTPRALCYQLKLVTPFIDRSINFPNITILLSKTEKPILLSDILTCLIKCINILYYRPKLSRVEHNSQNVHVMLPPVKTTVWHITANTSIASCNRVASRALCYQLKLVTPLWTVQLIFQRLQYCFQKLWDPAYFRVF